MKKTLLSCGASVVAAALILSPVSAFAADEVSDETTAVVAPATVEAPEATEATEAPEAAAPETAEAPALVFSEPVNTAPAEAPVAAAEVEPVAGIPAPLISTDGLKPIGTGVRQSSPLAPRVEYQKYMPSVRAAEISGYARPEGNRAPDEVVLDLWALVGSHSDSPSGPVVESGFRYTETGALASRPDTGERAEGARYGDQLALADFAIDVEAIGRTGIASNTTATDGRVHIVALAEHAVYGVKVTLRHRETGVTSDPVTVTGRSGVDGGSPFAWVNEAPMRSASNGIAFWKAADRIEWRQGRALTWADPAETIAPAGGTAVTPNVVQQAPVGGSATVPGGFGLTRHEDGTLQAGLEGELPSYRVGVLTGEPTQAVSVDLADRIPGAVAVAIPSAESGTLSLPATGGLWSYNKQFVGLDYNAPEGLNVSVSGSTITFDFGSAEWLNGVGIVVPVLLADGTRVLSEVRTESLPRDIAGGLVTKQIPVETPLFISDNEMLTASRLTGLSPSMAEVQAAELPEGVTRVADGFQYDGSAEPTELSFGFTVAETVETEYGPVRPDVAAPGEVRIAVVAAEAPVTPPAPEPTPGQETPAVVTPPTASAPPTAPADPSFHLGDGGPLVTADNTTASASSPVQFIVLGLAGGLGILGLVALSAVVLRRRAEG